MSPAEIEAEVIERFKRAGDTFAQFDVLLDYACELGELTDAEKIPDVLIDGCQSQVWLYPSWREGKFELTGDSDTLMVRGVIQMFALMFNGQSPEDIVGYPVHFVDETELKYIFDAKRQSGVSAIFKRIEQSAQDELSARASRSA